MLEMRDQAAELEGIETDRAAEVDCGKLPSLDQALHGARVDMEQLSCLACRQECGPIGDVAGHVDGCHRRRRLNSGGFRASRFELRGRRRDVIVGEEFEGELPVAGVHPISVAKVGRNCE
jgi:hypothetical protein